MRGRVRLRLRLRLSSGLGFRLRLLGLRLGLGLGLGSGSELGLGLGVGLGLAAPYRTREGRGGAVGCSEATQRHASARVLAPGGGQRYGGCMVPEAGTRTVRGAPGQRLPCASGPYSTAYAYLVPMSSTAAARYGAT